MAALTEAQKKLLAEVIAGELHWADTYRPAQQLVAKGLCVWKDGKYSKLLLSTEAGRRALAEQEKTR